MNKAAKQKMQEAVEYLRQELNTVRTGRANTALVENIMVNVYNQPTPLKGIANISTPDGKSLMITPWDQGNTAAVEKAISEDKNLQLNPVSDGRVIHINIPPMNSERRQQLVRQVAEITETAHISLRNARHDALKLAQTQLKNKEISEDEFDRTKKHLDELVTEFGAEIDTQSEAKKQAVQEV